MSDAERAAARLLNAPVPVYCPCGSDGFEYAEGWVCARCCRRLASAR
jgi:hypothetical protein